MVRKLSQRNEMTMIKLQVEFTIETHQYIPWRPRPEYAMQMLTLLVIFESVVFHEEISRETRTLYSMNQAHFIINSSNCMYFLK